MEQEKKLAEYRARKHKEFQMQQYKNGFAKIFNWRKETSSTGLEENEVMLNDTVESDNSNEELPKPARIVPNNPTETLYPPSNLRYEFYIFFAILWVATYILFIQLQFGIIYLIISAIFGIYLNTRTGPKDKNEISAYSVFNKNCESIDGTLKAEQFEREIRFGPMNVH